MQLRCVVLTTALFIAVTTLGTMSSLVYYTILGEVNARSPEDKQFSLFWNKHLMFVVLRRHSQLFPQSNRRRIHNGLLAACFVLFFVTIFVVFSCWE